MKQGDLVTLSAKGLRNKYLNYLRGRLGIVVEIVHYGSLNDYKVQWLGGATAQRTRHRRKELKYAN